MGRECLILLYTLNVLGDKAAVNGSVINVQLIEVQLSEDT
jgi:hypothetical protein